MTDHAFSEFILVDDLTDDETNELVDTVNQSDRFQAEYDDVGFESVTITRTDTQTKEENE
jgi:hypothetical protein